jgi:hypothetical protein
MFDQKLKEREKNLTQGRRDTPTGSRRSSGEGGAGAEDRQKKGAPAAADAPIWDVLKRAAART